MSHVLTTSKLYYGQFCKVKRILVCLQIEAIKLDETQPVNLNNFLTANLIVNVTHDFSKDPRLKDGHCTLFFCHSHSHSHNDIGNVYLLFHLKQQDKHCIRHYDCDYDCDKKK